MIIANNALEQSLLLDAASAQVFKRDGFDPENVSPADLLACKNIGFLDAANDLSAVGTAISTVIHEPRAVIGVSMLHNPDECAINLYLGVDEVEIVADQIQRDGHTTGKKIITRTTHESSLRHLLAWINLPPVKLPHELESKEFVLADLVAGNEFEVTRAWSVQSSASAAPMLLIFAEQCLWFAAAGETRGEHVIISAAPVDAMDANSAIFGVWQDVMAGLK